MEDVGSLIIFKNMTAEQQELFIRLIGDDYSSNIQVLYNIIEDKNKALMLIDLFAGKKLAFPDRKKLYRLLEKIKIYTYVKNHNFSKQSLVTMAKQYKRRTSQIKTIVNRIEHLLNNGKIHDAELDNEEGYPDMEA